MRNNIICGAMCTVVMGVCSGDWTMSIALGAFVAVLLTTAEATISGVLYPVLHGMEKKAGSVLRKEK